MTYYEEEPVHREPGPVAKFSVQVESFDTSTFYADMVKSAVEKIVGRSGYSPSAMEKRIAEAVQAQVAKRLDEALESAVATLISTPIQAFDVFGKPVGTASSLADIVSHGATAYLTETVDVHGKPTKDPYPTKKSRLEWMLEKVVVTGLSKEMEVHAKGVRAEVTKRAAAAAAAVLAGVKA